MCFFFSTVLLFKAVGKIKNINSHPPQFFTKFGRESKNLFGVAYTKSKINGLTEGLFHHTVIEYSLLVDMILCLVPEKENTFIYTMYRLHHDKADFVACKQQRCRPGLASDQFDQSPGGYSDIFIHT